jgi:hypothetical protein
MPPPPTERANATEWHTEETRALSATLKRLPSFAEWLVANKAHLECEAEIDERVQHQRTDHDVRKAVNTALAERAPTKRNAPCAAIRGSSSAARRARTTSRKRRAAAVAAEEDAAGVFDVEAARFVRATVRQSFGPNRTIS